MWFVVATAFAVVLTNWLGLTEAAIVVGIVGLLVLALLYREELKFAAASRWILDKGAQRPMPALISVALAGGIIGAVLFGGSWLWMIRDYRKNPPPPPSEPADARIVTVSPRRILVRSKEWSRVDIVTITNHEEHPRYGVSFLVEPSTQEIEYDIEGPHNIRLGYTDGSTGIPIFQIGPKASYVFHVKSRLRSDAKSTQAEIRLSVTDGTDEPDQPGVMIKQ